MKSRLLSLFSALALGAAASGCGEALGPAPTPDGPIVGFSQIETDSSWRSAMVESAEAEARRRGYELRISDAQHQQNYQISGLRSFVAQGVDIIVLAPTVETGWDSVLAEVQNAGIPVVLVDRLVDVDDESLYVTAVGSDFHEEGRLAAEWIAERTGGEARIVELRGSEGNTAAIQREAGFAEVVEEHAGMEIVASEAANFGATAAKEEIAAALETMGADGFDAIYAHNDSMGLGAIEALEEAGISPGEDILVVSIDGSRAALEAIIQGALNCSVESNPVIGVELFDAIDSILEGEEVPRRIVVPSQVFDETNALEALPERRY